MYGARSLKKLPHFVGTLSILCGSARFSLKMYHFRCSSIVIDSIFGYFVPVLILSFSNLYHSLLVSILIIK